MNHLIEERISPIEIIANENRAIILLLRQIANNLTYDVGLLREDVAELKADVAELKDDVQMLQRNQSAIIGLLNKISMDIREIKQKK